MLRSYSLHYLMLCAVLLWAASPGVYALEFHVEDANGKPLPDAVILLPGVEDKGTDNKGADTVAVMDQIDKSFVPYVLVIQQGQQVVFPNSDNIRHHVYSFSPAKPFEIKLYAGVPEAPILFDQPGIVVLGCNIHDSMLGYIVVSHSGRAGKTDSKGNVAMAPGPAPDTLQIWHPLLSEPVPALVTLPMPAAGDDGIRKVRLSVAASPPEPKRSGFGNRLQRHEP